MSAIDKNGFYFVKTDLTTRSTIWFSRECTRHLCSYRATFFCFIDWCLCPWFRSRLMKYKGWVFPEHACLVTKFYGFTARMINVEENKNTRESTLFSPLLQLSHPKNYLVVTRIKSTVILTAIQYTDPAITDGKICTIGSRDPGSLRTALFHTISYWIVKADIQLLRSNNKSRWIPNLILTSLVRILSISEKFSED